MDTKEKDHVLDAVPADRAPALAKALIKYGVTDGDPIFEIVKIAVDSDASRAAASAAANAAGEAAVKVGAAVASIQNEILQGTQRASVDLKAGVAQAIEAKTLDAGAALLQAIGVAASRGAGELQKAAAGLDNLGAQKGAAFVEQWKASLAKAAADQARNARAGALARSWGAVAGALLVMMFLGAGIMFGFEMVEHKIIISPNAEWRGHEVVFTSPHVYHVQCPWGVCFSSRPAQQ